jgi:hypothetical protein
MNPETDPHYSFCCLKFLGIHFCPGCGIGHSISYLLHGNISSSLSAHPLGIFAVIIILSRIYKLSSRKLSGHIFSNLKINDHGIRK